MDNHPKAGDPNFYADDYKEFKREEKDDWTIIHKSNSGNRIMIEEHLPEGSNLLPNRIFPHGGCNLIGGSIFCSFSHIDWEIPPKQVRDVPTVGN